MNTIAQLGRVAARQMYKQAVQQAIPNWRETTPIEQGGYPGTPHSFPPEPDFHPPGKTEPRERRTARVRPAQPDNVLPSTSGDKRSYGQQVVNHINNPYGALRELFGGPANRGGIFGSSIGRSR